MHCPKNYNNNEKRDTLIKLKKCQQRLTFDFCVALVWAEKRRNTKARTGNEKEQKKGKQVELL